MKLAARYNRLNITATIITFVAGSCALYFMLNYILLGELDERMETEQQEIQAYVETHRSLPDIVKTKDQITTFDTISAPVKTQLITIKNTQNTESANMRQIVFTVRCSGRYYLAKVAAPLDETEQLLQVIIAVSILMIAIMVIIGFIVNRIVIGKLWQPFYETITRVKKYHPDDKGPMQLTDTGIDEFSLLNNTFSELAGRIQQDYSALKDFTSQAAHEMQTPLAIIRGKMDALMQNSALTEQSAAHIADMEKAVHRLSRLHQSLLLLTKVENRQFLLNEQIGFDKILEEKCDEYAEMAAAMQLTINISLQPVNLLFHRHLAEIVAGNLLSNAIRYNTPGGYINIELRNNTFTIANTSRTTQLDMGRLFKRFYMEDNTSGGTGLGLSIVKQVCDVAGFTIAYSYLNDMHRFTITF